ncbi:MAG: Cna B-type domain-containing protein, partial [Clostridia bacterium]|nr:Cna B-type domain-containing protein [Clostridia bacterium]
MKLKGKTIRNISIPVILMTICCLILFYNSDTTYTEATPVATGNKAVIQWSEQIGAYHHFKKTTDLYTNFNLFCIQKGESIKSWNTSEYTEYSWEYDAQVFKDVDSYNKLTWIKDNFWEQSIVQSEDYKYTTAEKLKILKTVSNDITEADIENVYGNYIQKFRLYQYITWTYAQNIEGFNPNNQYTINKYLGGNNTSLYKVYTAIINLAEANYKNTNTSKDISIYSIKDAYYDDESGNYKWEIAINNSYLMPYNMNLKVNGENYDKSKYSYSDNKLVISGLNKNEIYSFEVLVDVYSVTTTKASIWKHVEWQNMIEIETTKQYDYATLSSSAGEVGAYNFSIRKYDSKDNTKNLSNMQFEVQAPNGTDTYTTNDNGIAQITTEEGIDDAGTIYTYIINEIPEQNSTASDKTNTQKYVKLKEPVKIELVSGVTTVNNIHINYISEAHFENGQDEFEATLVNGKTVKLTLENNIDNTNAKSTITLNIPNTEKIYDLALTKTIIQNSYNPNLDYNFNGEIDMQDSSIYMYATSNYNLNLNIEECRTALSNQYSKIYEEYYKTMSDIRLMYMLDYDKDGIIDLDATIGGNLILESMANTTVGNDIDRVNNVNDTELNNKSNENYITTSSYNMNKQTYKVAKGDIVLYRINVYNEGDYDAKEIEVTDYIPEGLTVCSMAGDTTLNTNNQISVAYNGGTYTWTISNNGRTAKCTINDTISAYEKNSGLQNKHVYIACKVTDADNFKVGDILYNVAEITASTAVNKDGTTVAKQGDGDSEIKDRDSDKDSIKQDKTEQTLIDEYETSFLETSKDSSVGEIDKNIYDYQDDDDFERVEISNEKLLDLALRKSISKIGPSETSMNSTEGRIPVINENTTAVFDEGDTTGEYIHKKGYVTVDYDNYVEYTIRIYNEGGINDYSGYAKQITDYLPDGIEFHAIVDSNGSWIEQSTNNTCTTTINEYGGYEVIYDAQSNKVTINCNNVKTLEPTDYLSLLEYYTKNGNINSYYSTDNTDNKCLYGYQEVKLICKVTENAKALTNLTNIAEITEYVATDNEGNVVENVQDKDSKAATVKIGSENKSDEENEIQYTNLNTYYEYKGVEDEYFDYYAGWQDDDDFETIQVNRPTGTYDFEITKIDESGDKIEDEVTEFEVKVYQDAIEDEENGKVTFDSQIFISTENAMITQTSFETTTGVVKDLNGIKITSQELADADKTYYFVITETKAPDEYTAIDYKVVVPVTYSQSGSKYVATKGVAFAVNSENTKIDLDDNATTYNEATVSQNGVTINVKVPNKKIEKTSKSVKKVWEDNNNQDGIRPGSIEVTLLADDKQYSADGVENPVTLNEGNSWSHTWNNLPKYANGTEINYEIKEIQVPDGYTSTSEEDGNVTTITNKHTPEVTERTVKKVWEDNNNQDGKRPSSIEVTLLADDEQYSAEGVQNPVTLNEGNSWSYTWNNLPKYANGTEINYEIKELQVPDGYTSETKVQGNTTTITNEYAPDKTSKSVKKVWEDNNNQDGIRPGSIEVTLLADD